METKVYLCAFASPDLNLSVKRFVNQALDLNIYKDIKIFRTKDLSKRLNEKIKELINTRGKYLYIASLLVPNI